MGFELFPEYPARFEAEIPADEARRRLASVYRHIPAVRRYRSLLGYSSRTTLRGTRVNVSFGWWSDFDGELSDVGGRCVLTGTIRATPFSKMVLIAWLVGVGAMGVAGAVTAAEDSLFLSGLVLTIFGAFLGFALLLMRSGWRSNRYQIHTGIARALKDSDARE